MTSLTHYSNLFHELLTGVLAPARHQGEVSWVARHTSESSLSQASPEYYSASTRPSSPASRVRCAKFFRSRRPVSERRFRVHCGAHCSEHSSSVDPATATAAATCCESSACSM